MTLWHDHFFERENENSNSNQDNKDRKILDNKFERLNYIKFCPAALSELHLISHHLPIHVADGTYGPEVFLDLRPEKVLRSPLNREGQWSLNYKPLALRLLPDAAHSDGTPYIVHDKSSANLEDVQKVKEFSNRPILHQYAKGRKKLTDAVRSLIEDNYLQKSAEGFSYNINYSLTLDKNAPAPDPFAFQILVVIIFSRKNLRETDLGYDLLLEENLIERPGAELDVSEFLSVASSIDF